MCAIYDRALNGGASKQAFFADRGLTVPDKNRLLACWPFG